MTSSLTQSLKPIERARRAIRTASWAVWQPAVLGRIRNRFQSITSRSVCWLGSARSSLRRATVTSSAPDASRAASISSSLRYLPVPRKSRERSWTPAITKLSEAVVTATGYRLRRCQRLSGRQAGAPGIGVRRRSQLADDEHLAERAGRARGGDYFGELCVECGQGGRGIHKLAAGRRLHRQ